MSRVLLVKLKITNIGPIKEEGVFVNKSTFLVERNNVGRPHYLRAIEALSSTETKKEQISKLQHDKNQPIVIKGYFEGVSGLTDLVTVSN